MTESVPLLLLGPLPPPAHGAAMVTEAAKQAFVLSGRSVIVVNTNPKPKPRLSYHLRRIVAHVRAAVELLRITGTRGSTLYVGGAGGLGLWYQLGVIFVGSRLGLRIVFHHHSFEYLLRNRLAMRLLFRIPLNGGHHVALCNTMADKLSTLYAPDSRIIRVVPNSTVLVRSTVTHPRREPSHHRRPDSTFVLGHVSNLSLEKGLELVVRTFRYMVAEGLPVSLSLAGPLVTYEARRLVTSAKKEFADSLRYVGPLTQAQLPTWYRDLDLFLFPSRNEAAPLVVLDSLRSYVPVVAFDIGCLSSLVGGCGMVVPYGDDMLKAALELMADLRYRSPRARAILTALQVWNDRDIETHSDSGDHPYRSVEAALLG